VQDRSECCPKIPATAQECVLPSVEMCCSDLKSAAKAQNCSALLKKYLQQLKKVCVRVEKRRGGGGWWGLNTYNSSRGGLACVCVVVVS